MRGAQRERGTSERLADYHAIQATCDAIMRLMQESYRPDLIEPLLNLQFEVYGTEDFKNHMAQGVSLFLYRVHFNEIQRSPLTKDTDGRVRRQMLPLDLHFFLTVWGPKASLQHAISVRRCAYSKPRRYCRLLF